MSVPVVSIPATHDPRSLAIDSAAPARRILLVGTGPRAVRIARALETAPGGPVIIGAVDNRPQPALSVHPPFIRCLGGISSLPQIVHDHGVDEIRVALPVKSCFDEWVAVQGMARELGVPVAFDLDLFAGARPADVAVEADRLILSCNRHPARQLRARLAKRALDVSVALLALLLLAPLLLLAAVAVKLESRGPLLFRQRRLGLGRRPFYMLKFRTMVANAEELQPEVEGLNAAGGILFKIPNDPRVTVVGRLLRRTSIDELPQLLNVLRGEMSLVGPRPLPVWEYDKVDRPTYHRRFTVLPGLTGEWQVNGRVQDFERMADHDLRYVDTWSLRRDLAILAATIPAVLRGDGAH